MVFENDSTLENFSDLGISVPEENEFTKNSFDERNDVADDVAYLKKLLIEKKNLPSDFDQLTIQEQHDFLYGKIRENCKNLSTTVAEILPSLIRPGDSGKSMTEKPEWLDMDKFLRGQKFMFDHFPSYCYAQLCSLYLLFGSNSALETLIMTEKSHTPYLAFERYTSTLVYFRTWYRGDLWDKDSEAFRSIRAVRKMHKLANEKVVKMKKSGETAGSKIPNICCPMWNSVTMDMKSKRSIDLSELVVFSDDLQDSMPINQGSMSLTQGIFASLLILFPQDFGIHGATEEDIESLCHMWRGLGYLVGIEDEYNFFRGSMEEIKKRARDMLFESLQLCYHVRTPTWEHMLRCIFEGMGDFLPGLDFTATFLHLMDLLAVETPKIRASLSYTSWIKYHCWKFLFRHLTKVPGFMSIMNYCVNYRLDSVTNYGPEKLAKLQAKSAAKMLKLSSA